MHPLFGKYVLVVEDEPLIALMLEEGLQEAGARVAAVQTSTAAIAALGNECFDLAILDFRLSDGTCTEVAARLQTEDVPYILATADPYAKKGGAHAVVAKPYLMDDVMSAAASALSKPRSPAVESKDQQPTAAT